MTTTTLPATRTWQIDAAHTQVEFAVKHMMIATVKGYFADVQGTLALDEADVTASKVDVTIGAASINTQQEQRDGHLRSADFFDVANYPSIRFTSTRVTPKGEGRYTVAGDMTIRDVTREVILDVEAQGRGIDPWGNEKIAFGATTKINRKDFGLTWNQALETGGVLVSEDVKISIEAQLAPAK